jgi:threonine dehydrogenase-like Zn-dependent dehydrogenase
MTETIRVARFRGAGRVELGERAPSPLAATDGRVRVRYCGLCGSDRRLFQSGARHVPGHEIAGVITGLGAEVGSDLKVGQRVIVYIVVFCGACRFCRAGQTNRCLAFENLVGWQLDGGFQESLDVPARLLLPVPDDVDLATAVLALDTVGTAAHGLRSALVALGGTPPEALVVGCGPLGLGTVAVARHLGVGTVRAADLVERRRQAARSLGAEAIDLGSAPDRSYPLVVEATGRAPAREAAWSLVEPGGVLLLLGEGEDPWVIPATPRWRRTDMYTVRSFYFPVSEVADNWEILRAQGDRLRDTLVTTHPLPALEAVFTKFTTGELLKPLIEHSSDGV